MAQHTWACSACVCVCSTLQGDSWLLACTGEYDEDEEEDTSSRGGTLSDEQKAAPKPAPVRDIRKGVHELEGAADNVHYAAAIAALVGCPAAGCMPSFTRLHACMLRPCQSVVPCSRLWLGHIHCACCLQSDGVRERPSESEADAAMATGGDIDVNDGHHSHLQSRPGAANDAHAPAANQPPDARHPADGHAPAGAHVIDMLHAVSPFAAHHRQSSTTQPGSPTSPASDAARSAPQRSGSVISEGSSDGEMPDADAPVHNYAGKMVSAGWLGACVIARVLLHWLTAACAGVMIAASQMIQDLFSQTLCPTQLTSPRACAPQEGGRCRYTQLNGVSCKHRIADVQRRKHQAGGFCLLKVRGTGQPRAPCWCCVLRCAASGQLERAAFVGRCTAWARQALNSTSGTDCGSGPAQGAGRGGGVRPGALQPHHRRPHVHEDEDAGVPYGLGQPDAGPLRLRQPSGGIAAGQLVSLQQLPGICTCTRGSVAGLVAARKGHVHVV